MTARPAAASEPEGEAMSSATPDTLELAARETNGLHVLLLWHPRENAVTVSVEDTRAGDHFQLAVARDSRPRCLLPPLRLCRLTSPSRTAERRTHHVPAPESRRHRP